MKAFFKSLSFLLTIRGGSLNKALLRLPPIFAIKHDIKLVHKHLNIHWKVKHTLNK